jgi:hypothetical protein
MSKNEITIIDNFLPHGVFKKIQNSVLYGNIPWQFYNFKVKEEESDLKDFQFVHTIFYEYSIQSKYFYEILPLLNLIDAAAFLKIKINLTTRWDEIIEFDPHVDHLVDNAKTSIFYLNSNNGYTRFIKENKKVFSKENRLVTFSSNLEHCGSTHTNTKIRSLININYIEKIKNN